LIRHGFYFFPISKQNVNPKLGCKGGVFSEVAARQVASPDAVLSAYRIKAGAKKGPTVTSGRVLLRPQLAKSSRSHGLICHRRSHHFSLLDERGCLTCHERSSKADYAAAFKQRDPAKFNRNFKPLPRAVCAECHTAAKAGDNCLTCHNYHLGVFQPVVAHTKDMFKNAAKKSPK